MSDVFRRADGKRRPEVGSTGPYGKTMLPVGSERGGKDGIPLADLIEPEECDGCEPGAWEVVAMEVAERLGVAVGGCLPSDYADAIGEALDRRLMPEGYEWRVEPDGFCAWGEERGDDRD